MKLKVLFALIATAALLTGCQTLPGQDGDSTPSDQQITDQVLQRFQDDPITGRTTFNVEAQNGVVTLRGLVHTESVKGRAIGIARGTPGVVDVVDRIDLR